MSGTDQPSILMILTWFGPWPGWMRLFLESCRWNPTVDWLIAGDAPAPADAPPNVRFLTMSFEAWREMAAKRLGVTLAWREPYKLCDLKPAYAVIHADVVAPYDYWGFGDLDVIYGDIRRHYDAETLSHDLVTTHDDVVAGHFTLLRNEERMVRAYERIPGWRGMLADPAHVSFDEQVFSRLFLPLKGKQKLRRLFTPFLGGGLFVERFSTALPPRLWIDGTPDWPARWIWREGRLTPEGAPDRDFLYLHVSHWQSARWTRGQPAAWAGIEPLDQLPPGRPTAFAISAKGFTAV